MRTRRLYVMAAVAGLALLGATLPQWTAGAAEEKATYLVRLAEPPLAAYRGGVSGLAARRNDWQPDGLH